MVVLLLFTIQSISALIFKIFNSPISCQYMFVEIIPNCILSTFSAEFYKKFKEFQ